ncbi:glycosyltransferase [Clostridium sp. YIM B02515]|uniref:Glycosyltransferase n=1 Tax=Clostridium rhizosphaerae TaxID=2803861 RepID=A0ABS1T5S1_9CLOT|nr:glycosyltransferase [Clostridium rhizosphaerae]MBL4934675.1 glycosyltransferase [Clostridium rhizosphaerae]
MKVLLFTPTYRRPYMLRECILNIKNQSYTDFTHTISIMYDDKSEIENYQYLFDDIIDDRFIIGFNKNNSSFGRYIAALSQSPEPYDIYIKIDDDDIHKKDYVKTIVEYFETHECDILSSHISSQLNNYFLSKGNYRSLGGDYPNNNYLMPMTFAFSHKAYEIILGIKDNYDHDDLQWRTAWSNCGLKDDNVDNSNNIIWHIHGKNASVGEWFRPS